MDSPLDPAESTAAVPIPAAPAVGDRRDRRAEACVEAEFSAFYRAFVPTLVGFLIWQGACAADAAEIAQDTMAAAFRSWDRIDHPAAWARRVASRAYARRLASVDEDLTAAPPERTPLLYGNADLDAVIDRHDAVRLLGLLPPRQRQVLAWTLYGYSPSEIAEELKISAAAVRGSLLKARRTLAQHLGGRKEAEPR